MAAAEPVNGSIDALEHVLSYLVKERQELRAANAGKMELEANRQAIVAMQSHLTRMLGEGHTSGSRR
jgi:hypothetical protein